MNLTVFGKRVCTDMIKLGISRWGDHLGLSGWALNALTTILIRERHKEIRYRYQRSQRWEWCFHKLQNICSHQTLDGQETDFPLELLKMQKHAALPTPWLQKSGFQKCAIMFLWSQRVCGSLLQQPRKTNTTARTGWGLKILLHPML